MPKKNDRTEMNKRILLEKFPTTPNGKIAALTNMSVSAIRSWAQELGLRKTEHYWTKFQHDFLMQNYGKPHITINEIANKIKKGRWSCINRYRDFSGKRNPPPKRKPV